MIWFSYFLKTFISALFLGIFLNYFRKFFKNKKKINRAGGTIVIVSFLLFFLFRNELEITSQIQGLLVGSVAILFFGIWDDCRKISWEKQLFFQLLLAFFLVWSGFEISHLKLFGDEVLTFNFFLGGAFFVFWLILVMNSINWLDGIDGLAGTVSMLAFFSIFLISLEPEVNQPAVAIMSLLLVGGIVAFLIFNLKFSFIAGTSGSYFFGFMLASLAVIAGMKIATLMLVIVFPLVDVFWVIFDRLQKGQSIFSGDKNSRHFHYRLVEIGWGKQKIVFFYFLFLIFVLSINYFLKNRDFKLLFLIGETFLINIFMYLVYRKINLKKNV